MSIFFVVRSLAVVRRYSRANIGFSLPLHLSHAKAFIELAKALS